MIYTLKNQELTVSVNDLGAELWSVRREKDGFEYIWQGDPAYWEGRSPLMFPFCGRVQGGHYTYEGRKYPMGCHGFAQESVFDAEQKGEDTLCFSLCSSERTREVYPFDFSLTVTYRLVGKALVMWLSVENTGDRPLPFMLGAHPGFCVPLREEDFKAWTVEFGEPCAPKCMEISPNGFRTGKEERYPLGEERILHLSHTLFEVDGIFLKDMARSVCLRNAEGEKHVTLSFPDLPYLGFWHCQGNAPYLCIEPWGGMPAVEGQSEDLSSKTDLRWLEMGKKHEIAIEISFE